VAPDSIPLIMATTGAPISGWVMGMLEAANRGAKVINFSSQGIVPRRGGLTESGDIVTASEVAAAMAILSRTIDYVHNRARDGRSLVVVAAAGIGGADTDREPDVFRWPADLPHVIAVGGTTGQGWCLGLNNDLDYHAPESVDRQPGDAGCAERLHLVQESRSERQEPDVHDPQYHPPGLSMGPGADDRAPLGG
jgi:hypothetical protein